MKSQYATAVISSSQLTDQVLANTVVSCCVGWRQTAGATAGGNCLVPGTQTPWESLAYNALVFPAPNQCSVIPRYFFQERIRAMEQHCPPGVKFEFLYPDIEDILSKPKGAINSGVPWEKLIACSFAARFFIHCKANDIHLDTFIKLSELYPSSDDHVKAVLDPYVVCLKDGVVYPDTQVFADETPTSNAVIANTQVKKAHHDLLLPVTRSDNGEKHYIAFQCRYGVMKDANQLGNQRFVRPDCNTEVKLLLQCCSEFEGKQNFNKRHDKTGNVVRGYKEFQDDLKYACIDGKAISIAGTLLQVFKV
jgi:hypothetical protein